MHVLIAVALCLIVVGCRDVALQRSPSVRLLECPPPPMPQCQPAAWSGEPLDTSTVPPHRDERFWWRIRPVRGAATDAQEYAVCFFGSQRGALTRGTTAQQQLVAVHLIAADSLAVTGSDFVPNGYRSIGSISRSGETILAGVLPDGSRLACVVSIGGTLTDASSIRIAPLPIEQQQWTSHPALSSDGALMVVASNREGGYGGLDLWYSRRLASGQWDTLRNLGPAVNTPCDELSPFIAADGTLLFASNGHESVGGYDLFAAPLQRTPSGVVAGTPTNLRPPINTSADELFPSTPGDWRTLLYWSSNRRERNFDLYVADRVERPKAPPPAVAHDEEPTDTDETPRARVRGKVRTSDKRPVASADVSVRDIERRRTVARTQTDSSGTFEVTVPTERELELTAQSESGFYDTRRLRISRDDTLVTLAEDLTIPEVLTLRINFPHDQARVPYEFVLDSNGMQTDRRWSDELDRVAANILRYRDRIKRVVLVGHTDPNGSDAYNLDLGRRRVEFVIEELEKRGVPRSLLEGLSAGERQLLPRRAGEPTELYYRRNRRVELSKVLQ